MNHTERISYTAAKSRNLTRRLVKQAVEIYLEKLAEEIAEGEWVDLPGIGKIQVIVEHGSGKLTSRDKMGRSISINVGLRLRTKLRLSGKFKRKCYRQIDQ